jgi:hypothetical protein
MNVFGKGLRLWSFFRNPHKVVRGSSVIVLFRRCACGPRDGGSRKGSPRRWASPLTQELHRRFGCQLVFFTAGRHERPYGYVVIDHVNRNVVKGGEVLRMAQLIGPTASPGAMSRGMSEAGTKGREGFGAEEVQGNRPTNTILADTYRTPKSWLTLGNAEAGVPGSA